MGKGSGGTKKADKTHNHLNGKESPVLFHGDSDEWYDWDKKEAKEYIDTVTNYQVNSDEVVEALAAFVDSDQHEIRQALRGNGNRYYLAKARAIEEFIEVAPNYQGTTYRGIGMSEDEFSKLKVGIAYGRKGSTSWTTKADVARYFDHNPDGNEVKVVLRCQKQRAVSIRFIAKYTDEHEVIASGYNKYK